jgi:hypothetical protein
MIINQLNKFQNKTKIQKMKKTSLKQLVRTGVIRNISVLRSNMNGYPFVTVLSDGGRSQNLYFGQKTAELVMDNFSEGESIISFLADADIIQTQNELQKENGEWRFKLSKSPSSDYASEVSLADAFGIELTEGEFDTSLFKSTFVGKDEAITKNAPRTATV